jgi:hypothetical protein
MNTLNKIIGCGSVAVALALSASTTQAQNLLTDPGFESATGFVTGTGSNGSITNAQVGLGWDNNFGGSAQDRNGMSSSADSPNSGSYAMLAANAPGNAWNPQGSYQVIANSSVGSSWSASLYALTDTGTLGAAVAGTGLVDFQIQFINSTWGNISTIETGWSAINANDTWQQFNANGVIPAGTAYISVYDMAMIGPGASGTVNVYFDDNSLTVTPAPEPTTLALAGLGGAAALSLIRRRKS